MRGPPLAKGLLTASRLAEIVPLKGKNLGQLRVAKVVEGEILFDFALDADGHQRVPLVPIGEATRPGDGWFFQASIPDPTGGPGLQHTTADGGLYDPIPQD